MASLPRRRLLLLLLTIATVLLAAVAFFRDTTPPEFITLHLPSEAPVDEPLIVPFHMSEPVVLEFIASHATERVSEKTGEMVFPVAPGPQTITIVATDRAGNETTLSHTLVGRSTPTIELSVPELARRADAVTAELRIVTPEHAAAITDVAVKADGTRLPVHSGADGTVRALYSAALSSTNETTEFVATALDQFGREYEARATLTLSPRDDIIFELLELSNETLSLSTPEGREYEAQLFARVYEQASEHPFPRWSEPFIQPSEGWTSSNFGDERQYAVGGNISYHTGHDFATPQGTPIHATNDGVVVVAELLPLKGGTVAIDHGAGLVSLYLHQSEIIAEVGDEVKRGDVIGLVGTTGLSTGPHLHWEMRVHSVESAPSYYVGRVFP